MKSFSTQIFFCSVVLLLTMCSSSITAQWTSVLIDFESADSLVTLDTTNIGNVWQIGTPGKTFINNAYSIPNAIITDTINSYPVNCNSSFIVKISDPSWPGMGSNSVFFYFREAFDTDSLVDGGYVESSYDSMQTWTNLADDPNVFFYYDDINMQNPVISNGQKAFTGRSHDVFSTSIWHNSMASWCDPFPFLNPVFLRFTFYSDSTFDSKDGWAIDDLNILQFICEGIPEHVLNNVKVFPNPVSNELHIYYPAEEMLLNTEIFDVAGRVIRKKSTLINHTMDVSQLENGSYWIRVSTGDIDVVRRFIVVK